MGSAIYRGMVAHQRLRPRPHRLRYRVFALLLDLDELPGLERRLRLFGVNRAAPLSFHETDHGDGRRGGLRSWIELQLVALGLSTPGGRVQVLCYPRLFGLVFNPLTVYFCSDAGGQIRAILYEVSNTHGERHTYVIAVPEGAEDSGVVRQSAPKRFFVSPFLDMELSYDFAVELPGERVRIGIADRDAQGVVLAASFQGRRQGLDDAALLGCLLSYPLMTAKVIAAIHWEALRLWLKRIPVHRHARADDRFGTTVIGAPAFRKEHPADVRERNHPAAP